MFKKFYPFEYVESVFAIDYNKLYNLGYKAIIFDVDNTLVHHGDDSNENVDNLFREIHNTGLKTLLLSNNDIDRIKRFIKNIDTLYICDADKPSTVNYLKAIEMLEVKKDEAIYIGDQVFIDIVGANKAGIDNILVKFIGYYTETKIGIKRHLEKIILWFYKNSKYQNRLRHITKEE